jgi:hypothetical protein
MSVLLALEQRPEGLELQLVQRWPRFEHEGRLRDGDEARAGRFERGDHDLAYA